MTQSKGGQNKLIPQAVREALDSVVAPSVREALLDAALSESTESELPTDPERLRQFVAGPLKRSLVRTLGNELGESVVGELDRLATMASIAPSERRIRSGGSRTLPPPSRRLSPAPRASRPAALVRRSATPRPAALRAMVASTVPPPQSVREQKKNGEPRSAPQATEGTAHAPTIPAAKRVFDEPAAPASANFPRGTAAVFGMAGASSEGLRQLPFVLVATTDPNLVKKLAAWLDPRAAVVRVRSVASLLHDLENASGARSVIVLDCLRPSIRAVALAALAEDLPTSTRVVLWGATMEQEQQLRSLLPVTQGFITIHGSAQPKEVAARCAELVC